MRAIQLISNDLFDKVRSRFKNLEMGDETGAVTIDPSEARFFDFDFVNEGVDLGRVSISLNDLGSLKIYYSQGITENQDSMSKKMWYDFLKEMRLFAMRRLLRFDTRDIAKTNLDKNDFQFLAAKGPKEENMSMNESRWNHRSTKKTSRAVKGTTEVIVRHTESMDEMFPGARSMPKKIKAIFIQNRDGERFKYPFIHPAGAFAMAQHVDNGGVPHDPAGKAIIQMSEQIAQLQEFQRKVGRAQLHPDATGITERAQAKLQELKRHIDMLGKRHHYLSWRESLDQNPMDDGPITELDPVQMEQYKQKFTQTSFQEELAKFFPLLHSIMSEEIDIEEYVQEGGDKGNDEYCDSCDRPEKDCVCDDVKEGSFEAFEQWAEAVEQGKLTDDEIQELKQAIEQLPKDPKGLPQLQLTTAEQFFNEFGIDDADLGKKFKAMEEVDPSTNAFEVFQVWAKESYPELLVSLGMSGEEPAAEPAPVEEPAVAPEPAAEPAAPAPEEQPVAENTDMEMNPGTEDKGSMIKFIAERVKSFYNESNEFVGPFRGIEGIAIDIEKECSEKYGDKAGQQAGIIAKQFMEKLTKQWESKHGPIPGPVDSDDGLARLKELVGNIKQKVEGIGDQGMGGRDFNKNIMPSQEEGIEDRLKGLDPKNPVNIPAYQRKAASGDSAAAARKPKESSEMESILKLAGLAK